MQHTLDFIPLWGFMILTCLIAFLAAELGFRIGKYNAAKKDHPATSPIGSMVGATLGLLAFMLAFTFSLAASRYETRRTLVLEETNAIGTTYLRAGYLDEPQSTEIRNLLREYVDTRLTSIQAAKIQWSLDSPPLSS